MFSTMKHIFISFQPMEGGGGAVLIKITIQIMFILPSFHLNYEQGWKNKAGALYIFDAGCLDNNVYIV